MHSGNGSSAAPPKPRRDVLRTRHEELARRLVGSIMASPGLLYLNDDVARVTLAHMPTPPLRDAWQALQKTLAEVGQTDKALAPSQVLVNTQGIVDSESLYTYLMDGAFPREIELAGNTARALIDTARALDRARQMREAADALDAGEPLATVDEKLLSGAALETGTDIDHDIGAAVERILNSEPTRGYSTGIKWLDNVTGGLLPGEFWIIGGRYKGGKTRTARHLLLHFLLAEIPCSFFAVEGTWEPFGVDMVALLATKYLLNSGKGNEAVLSGKLLQRLGKDARSHLSPVQWDAVSRALSVVHSWMPKGLLRVYSAEKKHGSIQTIHDVRRFLRLDAARGTQVAFYDYAQRFSGGDTLFDAMREVALVSQDIVQELGIGLVGIVQRNEARNNDTDEEENWDAGGGIKGGGDLSAACDTYITTKYNIESFNEAKEQNRPNGEMVLRYNFGRWESACKQAMLVNRTSGYILGEVDRKVELSDL